MPRYDFANRRYADENDPRVRARRERNRHYGPGPFAPKRHGCSLWPKAAPNCCLSCRQEFAGDPRRNGESERHDPDYCAATRERERLYDLAEWYR